MAIWLGVSLAGRGGGRSEMGGVGLGGPPSPHRRDTWVQVGRPRGTGVGPREDRALLYSVGYGPSQKVQCHRYSATAGFLLGGLLKAFIFYADLPGA